MEGKVIAITGGASGIGLATAQLLASRGAKISIADVSQESLDKAVEDTLYTDDFMATKVDVRDVSSVSSWLKSTVDKFGPLDGAANIAGVIGPVSDQTSIRGLSEDDWDFVLGVNLTGVMHCMKEELKLMQSGSSIVNVASVAGLQGLSNCAPYCVSKHGVIALTKTAAKEEGRNGIRVNAVAP
jgi:NAD(P)-dependent dehydrogenase (short-subunit alcohol dehydrogenase family)